MASVWVVEAGAYEMRCVCGVFSSQKKAEAMVRKINSQYQSESDKDAEAEEYPLDDERYYAHLPDPLRLVISGENLKVAD